MKRFSKIIKWIISITLATYVLLIILLHVPTIQRNVGILTADFISSSLGTRVEIGRINLGFLNRVFVDNLKVNDQQGKSMLNVRRLAVTFDLPSFIMGDVEINTAQMFGLEAHLYRNSLHSPLNVQFLIDSLFSNDSEAPSQPLRLRIHTLLLRHCHVTYDVLNQERSATFSPHHLDIDNFALTTMLHIDESESIAEIGLRRMEFREKNSGLVLSSLRTNLFMHHDTIDIDTLRLGLSHSSITLGKSKLLKRKKLVLKNLDGQLETKDFIPFYQKFNTLNQSIRIHTPHIYIDSTRIVTSTLSCFTEKDSVSLVMLNLEAKKWRTKYCEIHTPQVNLKAHPLALSYLTSSLHLPHQVTKVLEHIGAIEMKSSLHYSPSVESYADGSLKTDGGQVDFKLQHQSEGTASANLTTNVNMQELLGEDSYGIGKVVGNIQLDYSTEKSCSLVAQLDSVEYKNKIVRDIDFDATYNKTQTLAAHFSSIDDALNIQIEALWQIDSHHLVASIKSDHLNPHALGLTSGMQGKSLTFNLNADVTGTNPCNLIGEIAMDSITVHSNDEVNEVFHLSHLTLNAHPTPFGRLLSAHGDFIDGQMELTHDFIVNYSDFDVQYHDIPLHLTARGTLDSLFTTVAWHTEGTAVIEGDLTARLDIDRKTFSPRSIHLQESSVWIDDTLWHLQPANIYFHDSQIDVDGLRLSHNSRFLSVEGTFSTNPSDSLICNMEDIDIAYVLSLVNFKAVRFGGLVSGKLLINRPNGQMQFTAQLRVDKFLLNDGCLGTAYIIAGQDNVAGGVRLDANILDRDEFGLIRRTICQGYIAPAKNDIHLTIHAQHTNVDFLNGFLHSTFRDISGSANGIMEVVGPLNNVNLVGDMTTDASLTLRTTGARYRVSPSDTLRFRPNRFLFNDITISDTIGNKGVVNGEVSHRNVKDFAYSFRFNTQNLLLYDEKDWNSDKFKGTIFADGRIQIQGSDGHPLFISADITPTRGSIFAYDAATPDAITTSNFVIFQDPSDAILHVQNEELSETKSTSDIQNDYTGDIFMEANIHMNPQCELRLRMDQTNEAYISAFGTGNIQAHYYNKGPFTLDGTYNIENGRYRLYLQDIIYRDLLLQPGSNVVFNGNPFDANIHLICHHTLQAVPITDLIGSTSSVGSTSRVRVICVLDITGNLGNMNLNFNIQLPNVNDEVRSIVRSFISTDEEMNRQMIYLLGLGRFYTAEYAQASRGNNASSSGAMNSLLSSTLSGQINQMLEGVIGQNSQWNFGTGLTTGEQGWQDLDVEGILSGHLLDDRLLINGNFGYRNNTLTQNASFIGDFDVKWRLREDGNTFLKAYNRANDRYFTKATLNTQGIGISYQKDFEIWRQLFSRSRKHLSNHPLIEVQHHSDSTLSNTNIK